MRILHYITDFTNTAGPQAAVARMMILSTSKVAENHLVTVVPLTPDYVRALLEQCNVHVYFLKGGTGRNPLDVMSLRTSMKHVLKKVNPDVVHIHGAWDWRAATMESVSRSKKAVTLVSPHRGLSAELLNIDFWSDKLPKLIAYQALMVRNCTAVIAVSDGECEDIKSLGLKKRIEVLPAVSRGNENIEQLGTALMIFYRKAVDSVYSKELTQKERDVVLAALCALIADDDVETAIPDINNVSFRRIYFHAYDEDVMPQFIEGCRKMQLQVPPPMNVAEIPRYRNPKAKTLGSLADVALQPDIRRIPADKVTERYAVALIYKARALTLTCLTLRQYMELYNLFRYTDFDEDMVVAELKRLRLLRFTGQLQIRLAKMFGLKKGYEITE